MRDKIAVFNFKEKTIKEIYLSNQFFERYKEYLIKNCLPYRVEDFVSFYLMEEGFKINRLYLQKKGGLDLIATKEDIMLEIEVKTRFDLLKHNQLEYIFLNDNCFVYWVLPDETDISDLRY